MTNNDDMDQMISSMVDNGKGSDKKNCDGWCAPLYIYIVLAVLQLLAIPMLKVYDPSTGKYVPASSSAKMQMALMTIIWNVIIGFLLYYLCKRCHGGWAWFVLLLPIIFSLLMLFGMFGFLWYASSYNKNMA